MTPNKPHIRKWVDALRSGEYRQGKAFLRSVKDQFCCLGVLCDLAVKEGVAEWTAPPPGGTAYACNGQVNHPPSAVRRWVGIPEKSPRLFVGGKTQDATYANDFGSTFPQIADAIERKYL